MIGYIRQAWLVLALAIGFGVALAGVNKELSPRIEANEEKAKAAAALDIFRPQGAAAEKVAVSLWSQDGRTRALEVFRILDANGQMLGWAAPVAGNGYADQIKMIVGLSPDASRLTGMQVLFNNETPGLGNEITNPKFRSQFAGKATYQRIKASKRDGLGPQEIHALSGATVSSQSVCDIILKDLAASGLIYKLCSLNAGPTTAETATQTATQEGASDAR